MWKRLDFETLSLYRPLSSKNLVNWSASEHESEKVEKKQSLPSLRRREVYLDRQLAFSPIAALCHQYSFELNRIHTH